MALINDFSRSLVLLFACAWAPAINAASELASTQILTIHNVERRAVGLKPMVWDAGLAKAADKYAAELAQTGRWNHSPPNARPGQGENLWMGTHGAFAVREMISDWSTEKSRFRAGQFPDVTRSGSWHEVGHYTQMIWPTTRNVGCSMRSSSEDDYLVCRYSEPGNVVGKPVG